MSVKLSQSNDNENFKISKYSFLDDRELTPLQLSPRPALLFKLNCQF